VFQRPEPARSEPEERCRFPKTSAKVTIHNWII